VYTYLLINLCSVVVPFFCSFEHRIAFYKNWKAIIPALLLPAVGFLIWDSLFTRLGVWGFNPRYITGLSLFNLPLEEVLFFFAVPYASLFTYVVLNHFVKIDVFGKLAKPLGLSLFAALVVIAGLHSDKLYTFWTALLAAVFLATHLFVLKRHYWSRLLFAYVVVLIPFFIVNGLLTGTGLEEPVVWYNNQENVGIRLLTIPIEDTIYGFLLIGLNITLYETFLTHFSVKS
jgi:lycopene cyclase domain-containing protein